MCEINFFTWSSIAHSVCKRAFSLLVKWKTTNIYIARTWGESFSVVESSGLLAREMDGLSSFFIWCSLVQSICERPFRLLTCLRRQAPNPGLNIWRQFVSLVLVKHLPRLLIFLDALRVMWICLRCAPWVRIKYYQMISFQQWIMPILKHPVNMRPCYS